MNGYQTISDAVRTAAAEHQYRYHDTDTNQLSRHKTQRPRFFLLRKAASATIDYLHRRPTRREPAPRLHPDTRS